MERCEVCGFVWDDVQVADVPPRVRAGTAALAALLRAEPQAAEIRPTPDRWSALEYAGHVRDVLANLRDRIVLGAVEDNPVPKGLHPDARVALGIYQADTPAVVAVELEVVAGLFVRTLEALDAEQLERPIFYAYPVAATRTLRWVAAQALHEVEHHLADAREDIAAASS